MTIPLFSSYGLKIFSNDGATVVASGIVKAPDGIASLHASCVKFLLASVKITIGHHVFSSEILDAAL